MEYAKDMIFNFGYKRVILIKNVFTTVKRINVRIKEICLFVFRIIKKWTSIMLNIFMRNKIISMSLILLTILMIADFMLINIFMKIFATLY